MDHFENWEPGAKKQEAIWHLVGPKLGITIEDLRRMDLVELASLAVARPTSLGVLTLELMRRPRRPDPVAGQLLLRAYREGQADSWLTASLLTRMPAEGGYAVAVEILGGACRTGDPLRAGEDAMSALGTEQGDVSNLAFEIIRIRGYSNAQRILVHAIRAARNAGRLRLSAAEDQDFERGSFGHDRTGRDAE